MGSLTACKHFEVPAPERRELSTYVPIPEIPSQIAIPIKVDFNNAIGDLKNSFKNPIASDSKAVKIPTALHIEQFILQTIMKEVEKFEEKFENITQTVCKETKSVCTKTENAVNKVCKNIPLGKLLCKIVTTPICTATDLVCVAQEVVVVGQKTILVPVKVTLSVQEEVLKAFDKIVELDAIVDYTVNLKDVNVDVKGDKISTSVDIDYKIKINSKLEALEGKIQLATLNGIASCGYDESLRKLQLNLDGVLTTKDGPSFEFSNPSWSIKWVDSCELTAFKIELEDIIGLPFIKKAVHKAIDKAVENLPKSINLKNKLDATWANINKPHAIGKDLWLIPGLTSAEISPVIGNGKELSTTLFVQGNPAVVFSEIANESRAPLSNIKIGKHDPRVDIKLDSKVSFSKAKEILLDRLKEENKLPVKFDSIDIYGSGGKLVLGVGITKPARGILYLIGTPEYDKNSNAIHFPDLEYSPETSAKLAELIDVVAHKKIVSLLRAKAVFDLDNYTKDAIEKLAHKTFPIGDSGNLVVNADKIGLSKVWVTEDGFFASIVLQGTADISISP